MKIIFNQFSVEVWAFLHLVYDTFLFLTLRFSTLQTEYAVWDSWEDSHCSWFLWFVCEGFSFSWGSTFDLQFPFVFCHWTMCAFAAEHFKSNQIYLKYYSNSSTSPSYLWSSTPWSLFLWGLCTTIIVLWLSHSPK